MSTKDTTLTGTLGTNTQGTGGGLVTNADDDLRLSPAERAAEQVSDTQIHVIDETRQEARDKSLDRDMIRNYVSDILPADAAPIERKDEDGNIVGYVDAIMPMYLVDADWRGQTIKPAAMKLDQSWPFMLRPCGINENGWTSILEGRHCVKCLSPHEQAWPEKCSHCHLEREVHKDVLLLMEERGEISTASSWMHRLNQLGLHYAG